MAKADLNDFLITNPLAQPGVIPTVPYGIEMIDLDDVPYLAEPQVNCAFCKFKQLHNKGYFAILSNGMRAPCGNCCAAKFDPVKKATIDRSRTRLKRERDERVAMLSITGGLDDVMAVATFVDQVLSQTAAATVVLRAALVPAALEDMRAKGIRGVDYVAKPVPSVAFAKSTIGAIRGRHEVKAAERERLLECRRQVIIQVASAVAFVKACADFFEADNLSAIETWANSHGSTFALTKFKVKGNILHPHGPAMWQNIEIPKIVIPPVVLAFHAPCE
jgi:hypothetical protein